MAPRPPSPWSARRLGAAALCCVLLALLLPLPVAFADHPGCPGGGEVVPTAAPGGDTATVAHAGATGSWRFVPAGTAAPGVPGQSPTGDGWATDVLTGVVPAGAWCVDATLSTTTRAGLAEGQVLAAIYAVGAASTRLLGVGASHDVLGGGGSTTVGLAVPLGEVSLRDEAVVVEWYLTVARHQTRGAVDYAVDAVATDLAVGALTLPGPPAAHPLVGPTRAAVTDPQDHRLTLTWQASTDDRVTAYAVRRATTAAGPFTELGVVTGTSFVVRDLANREPAFFDVVGVDADGVRTPASNVTQGRALDRTPPDAPAAPAVAPDGSGVLVVTWPASVAADLAGYHVERAATATGPFETIARNLTVRTLRDRDLPPQSTWWYRMRAVDDDGLLSAPSPMATTTTAPAVPTGLHLLAVGDGALTIGWDGISRPLSGYRVERAVGTSSFVAVGGLVTGTTFTDRGLQNGTEYRYRVVAEDRRGIRSSPSDVLSAVPRATGAPLPATYLTVTDGNRGALLEWGASPSPTVVGYQVLRAVAGGPATELGGLRTGRTFTDRDVVRGTRYEYTVVAVDASARRSPPTNGVTYVVAPSAPTQLRVTPVGTSTVALSWSPSDDPRAAYELWRAEGSGPAALVARTSTTTLEDSGLVLETRYRYFVRAVSAGFRASPASNIVEITLRDGPPSAPVAEAVDTTEGGSIEVRWRPPTESDVVSWRIERRVAGDARWDVVTDVPQPLRSHRDEGLVDGVRYEYRVIATDRGGAESPPSVVTSAVPTDTTPPPTPAAPTVRLTVGALAVDWDVAPTAVSYEVLRASAPEGPFTLLATTSLRAVRDAGVTPGATYHYRVVAIDAAGNASPPSPVGSGTFRTSVSPGSVLPVLPVVSSGGSAPPPAGAVGVGGGGVSAGPSAPFDPTRSLFPRLDPGTRGGVGGGAPSDAVTDSEGGRPDRSVLAVPDLGGLRDAVSAGDLPGAVGRVIGEVAGNVPDVARTFSVPLLLVVVIMFYLMAQGRLGRDAAVLTVEVPAGGDEDDVEFLL